jgi:hypothetical protein
VGDGEAFGIYTCLLGLSNAVTMINMGAAVSKYKRQVHREIKLELLNISDVVRQRDNNMDYWFKYVYKDRKDLQTVGTQKRVHDSSTYKVTD